MAGGKSWTDLYNQARPTTVIGTLQDSGEVTFRWEQGRHAVAAHGAWWRHVAAVVEPGDRREDAEVEAEVAVALRGRRGLLGRGRGAGGGGGRGLILRTPLRICARGMTLGQPALVSRVRGSQVPSLPRLPLPQGRVGPHDLDRLAPVQFQSAAAVAAPPVTVQEPKLRQRLECGVPVVEGAVSLGLGLADRLGVEVALHDADGALS
jgi:hypothetical protein